LAQVFRGLGEWAHKSDARHLRRSQQRAEYEKSPVNRAQLLDTIQRCGIVPAVRVQTEAQALRALEALGNGGIEVAEIAMSTPRAASILDAAIARFGSSMILGAGTVLDAATARHCILAGARFIVTPTLNLETIEMCLRYGVAVLPGALTPTEILAAWSAGAACVKVFPAGNMGGASYIRALKAPLPQIELMPMGGVTLVSAKEFLEAGSFALGVGSDLVHAGDLGGHGGTETTRRARQFRQIVIDFRRAGQ
jgi:2-dehydro-3-deoxyphosphogluconate aldolase/(4S)-4-hydroxy-2-oxoglutarate aldolase